MFLTFLNCTLEVSMNKVAKEIGLPEILQVNNEDFINFYDALEYLEFEGAISELNNVYFQFKGFVEGCIKDSADEKGDIKTEKVFLDGWVSVDLEDAEDFLAEFKENGESEVNYLSLYQGKAKNNKLTENDFEYYLTEINIDSSEIDVYVKKSDLDAISEQYGIPKKVWTSSDDLLEDDEIVTEREKTTYLNLIAVLLVYIDGANSEPRKKLEGFENKTGLINYITDNYKKCPGLSSRNLSAKMTEARNSLDQYLFDKE